MVEVTLHLAAPPRYCLPDREFNPEKCEVVYWAHGKSARAP